MRRLPAGDALSFSVVPLLLFSLPIVSTLLGGALAVRFRRQVVYLVAMGAGILLGAAFLDLLPEALTFGTAAGWTEGQVLGLALGSFLLFHSVETGLDALGQRLRKREMPGWVARRAAAVMLVFHSFRDGMAIGAAYAAAHSAGYAVALGIAAHDVGDGMNTVILTSGGETPGWGTYLFLLADALAPFLGGLLTVWWVLSARSSVILLVLAAGFFLQLATGDFLPEVRKNEDSRMFLLLAVVFGAALVYVANLLIGVAG